MKTPRILIVNQDHFLRSLDEGELRHAGYRTKCARSGGQPLAILAKGGFDLVLTDRNRQGINAFTLVRKLRAAGNQIPVMMVSVWVAPDGGVPDDVREEIAVVLPRPVMRRVLLAGVVRALRWTPAAPRKRSVGDSEATATPPSRSARRRCLHGHLLFLKRPAEQPMNSSCTTRRSVTRAFISAKAALALTVIAIGGGLLAYEWRHADSARPHVTSHHHHVANVVSESRP